MNALLELPAIEDQTVFNLDRWDEVCADPEAAKLPGRVETDRHGHVIMNTPAEYAHGGRQSSLVVLLARLLPEGKVTVECPISTSQGVKVADVAWVSHARLVKIGGRTALKSAPEICVEVISPSNTRGEIEEKRRVYFEAGATEVWICDRAGRIRFFKAQDPDAEAAASGLCLEMPDQVEA